MSCCNLLSSIFKGSSTIANEDIDVVTWYEGRPQHTGKWFVAHVKVVEELVNDVNLIGAPINIWDNFFSRHPVGDEYCKNFVAISLDEKDVKKLHEKIRLASYRWEDIKGVGHDGSAYHAPSNYLWFLHFLEKKRVLGWMDFMANIVVNCPGGETVAYMGSLYADYRTVSHWMLDPLRLEPALKRGWIFQETAFGAFDSGAISNILKQMRELAKSSLSSNISKSKQSRIQSCTTFLSIAKNLSQLLDRRGYYALAQTTPFLSERQYDYYHNLDKFGFIANVARLVVDRVLGDDKEFDEDFHSVAEDFVQQGYDKGYTAMFHICDLFTDEDDENFQVAYKVIKMLLITKTWSHASSVEELFENIGDPLLAAFSGLEVTYESDRDNALTQVAKAIVADSYGKELSHKEFCHGVWVGAADICLKTEGMIGSTVLRFQPTIKEGNRFIGGASMYGARLDGNGVYKTHDGSDYQADWALTCVTSYSNNFTWEDTTNSWANKDEDDANRYDIFLCKPPIGNNFFCGYVARLVGGGPLTHAQLFTDQSPPPFPEPYREATFS